MKRRIVTLVLALAFIMALNAEAFASGVEYKYHDQTNGFTCEIDSVGVLTATDLFGAPFKELMPGDEVTREIAIKNSYTGCKSVTIYIKAIAHDDEKNKPIANTPSVKKKLDDVPSMQRFLSCFDMTITDTKSGKELFNGTAEKLTLPEEYVSVGSFPKNEGTTLKVWLYANPERLTNEFANCAGEIDWQLLVEEYEEPGPDPTKPGPNPRPVPTPTPTTAPQGEPEGIQPARGPKTGDYSNVFLYGGLLLVSAGAAAGVIIAGKKKKENEE